jgi:hypothetical protein
MLMLVVVRLPKQLKMFQLNGVAVKMLSDSNALTAWKTNIFKIIDSPINCYCGNDHLPPKPGLTLRHLKKDILAFHSKFVMVPADKAGYNIINICRICNIYVLHKELNSTNAYFKTTASEKDILTFISLLFPVLKSEWMK